MFTIAGSYRASLFFIVLFVCSPLRAFAAAQWITPCDCSEAIQFSPDVRREVERLLQFSATFRSQYRRIADAALIVIGVRVDATLPQGLKARSTFRRYDSGLIVVAVAISPGSAEGEWIAHEFEHIIEQLEGWPLPSLARGRDVDVWYSGEQTIETGRAVRAGKTVHDELRRRNHVSDNFVE